MMNLYEYQHFGDIFPIFFSVFSGRYNVWELRILNVYRFPSPTFVVNLIPVIAMFHTSFMEDFAHQSITCTEHVKTMNTKFVMSFLHSISPAELLFTNNEHCRYLLHFVIAIDVLGWPTPCNLFVQSMCNRSCVVYCLSVLSSCLFPRTHSRCHINSTFHYLLLNTHQSTHMHTNTLGSSAHSYSLELPKIRIKMLVTILLVDNHWLHKALFLDA